jgi:hypothetical protein
VRIPNAKKLTLLFGSYVENKLGFSWWKSTCT